MAAITHPNLALILGAETWGGTPVLVLEYLAGGTLQERVPLFGQQTETGLSGTPLYMSPEALEGGRADPPASTSGASPSSCSRPSRESAPSSVRRLLAR